MRRTKMILDQNVNMPVRHLTAVPRSMIQEGCAHLNVDDGQCLDCGAEIEPLYDFSEIDFDIASGDE